MEKLPTQEKTKEFDRKEEARLLKEKLMNDSYRTIETKLSNEQGFIFKENQKAVLKLKIERYFQNHENIDTNVLFDALIETPKFLDNEKGGLHRLLEIHEQKTIQKIAEIRRKRAEMTGQEGLNPYEALFETDNGKYYMARLLNMPHLEEESDYMSHCVGTGDSYVNKIKKGEVEILSFRNTQTINKENNKLNNDDKPIFTIEYNLKTKTIEQMKSYDDGYLSKSDPYYNDVIESLKKLRGTKTDTNENRDFKKINESELSNFEVKDYHILTEDGEVNFKDFNPDNNTFVLRIGNMPISQDTPKNYAIKIIQIVEGLKIKEDELAYNINEINEKTKVYIGQWTPFVAKKIPQNTNHIYESFPEDIVFKKTIELSTKTPEQYIKEIEDKGMQAGDYTKNVLNKIKPLENNQRIDLVLFTVAQLGFPNGATVQELYNKANELGLDLCPPQVGPELRLLYTDQPNDQSLNIAMEAIRDGGLRMFNIHKTYSVMYLGLNNGNPDIKHNSNVKFIFCVPK